MFGHWQNQKYDEIPAGIETNGGNAIYLPTMMKFQGGIEIICGITNQA